MEAHRAFLAGLLAALFAAGPAEAQIRVGFELGVSASSLDLEPKGLAGGVEALDEGRIGLVAGATLAHHLEPRLDVETGLRWIQKGARGSLQGFEEPIRTDVRLSYLQVPLLLRVTPFPSLPARLSLAAGPAVSFETYCETDQDVSTLAVLVGCDSDRSTTDLELLLGMALAWRMGRADLMLDARYDLGLRDIDSIDALHTHTRGFTLAPRVSVPVGSRITGVNGHGSVGHGDEP